MARLIWIATGLAWATASLTVLAGAAFWDAVTALDYAAVYSYTVSWLLLALSIMAVGRLVAAPSVRVVAVVVAMAATTAGIANVAEDAFDLAAADPFYVAGSLMTIASLFALAIALARAGAATLAGVTLLLALGMFLVSAGGGLLILGALGWLALRGARRTRPSPIPAEPA